MNTILISISGGPDSISLMLLLYSILKDTNIIILSVTIDHKIQKNLSLEYKRLFNYFKFFRIEYYIINWEYKFLKKNKQFSSRNARYNLLYKFCIKKKIKYLFVAHHNNDLIETILLNILRGSGVDGLVPMNYKCKLYYIKIIRPLLLLCKKHLIKYINKKQILWNTDLSNQNINFYRIKIRNFLNFLYKEFFLIKKINLLNNNAYRCRIFLENYTKKIFYKYCYFGYYGEIYLEYNIFLQLYDEIFLRLFNIIIRYINQSYIYPQSLKNINNIFYFFKNYFIRKITLSNCMICKYNKIILFFKERKFIEKLHLIKNYNYIWDNRYYLFIKKKNFKIKKLNTFYLNKKIKRKFIQSILVLIIKTTPIIINEKNHYINPFYMSYYKIILKHLNKI